MLIVLFQIQGFPIVICFCAVEDDDGNDAVRLYSDSVEVIVQNIQREQPHHHPSESRKNYGRNHKSNIY